MIQTQAQIGETCARIRADGVFAFDTEFVMEDRYEAEVCLIQLATTGGVALIDPFLGLELGPVWDLVSDPAVEAVAHAAQEDLALCVQHAGKLPANVFDVQIAAGLVTTDYPLSLQKLVQQTMHVRLHKARTLTDWRRRPLSPEQVRYGAEDVAYLLSIRSKLHGRLARRGRLAWATEEFKRFEDPKLYRLVEEDKIVRVKGAGALTGRQLAVVHELLEWRDDAARQLNRPPRVVLKDYLLVEIARHGFTSAREIHDLRGISIPARHVRTLCDAVARGLATPSERWPATKKNIVETPRDTALVALGTAVVRSYCLDHDIAHNLAATKRSINQLVRYRTDASTRRGATPDLLRGWRGASVGRVLDDVLTGRRCIHVEHGNGGASVCFGERRA